jgi:hypothetical protein
MTPRAASTTPDAGFATPAAAVVSLAIAIGVIAVSNACLGDLAAAKRGFEQRQTALALDGAQHLVSADLVRAGGARMRWTMPSPVGPLDVLAEPEAGKVGLAAARQLDDATLAGMGVNDADAARSRLAKLASASDITPETIDAVDGSAIWRRCARSVLSRYGQARRVRLVPAPAPIWAETPSAAGQVWRVRIRAANGWTDDRLERIIGEPASPGTVIERSLRRTSSPESDCETKISTPIGG